METAMCCGRVSISPNPAFNPYKSGDRHLLNKKSLYQSSSANMPAAAVGKGGGLLERPTIETTPGRESEFDIRYSQHRNVLFSFCAIGRGLLKISTPEKQVAKKSRKVAPPYRVLLHNDNFNKREYVVQVLMKVIPGMTLDNAVNIMQEAHYNGLSVVIICTQADAEEHCMQLRGNGLLSSMEPDGSGC